jgi:hypothetical protein
MQYTLEKMIRMISLKSLKNNLNFPRNSFLFPTLYSLIYHKTLFPEIVSVTFKAPSDTDLVYRSYLYFLQINILIHKLEELSIIT